MGKDEIEVLRRKLNKARSQEKLREISDYCCSLAACLSEDDEHEEALNLYKESLKACQILDYKEGITLAHRMIAEECINLGYFDEGLKHVKTFLEVAQKSYNKVEEQRALVLQGQVFFTEAEYLIADNVENTETINKLLEQSMDSYRKSYAICENELTNVLEKERLQMKARLLQNKSLVLIRQNKLDHAQNHLIRAVKICTQEKLKDTERICYISLGDLYVQKKEYENALNVFDKAFELSHTTQMKIDSLQAKAKVYILMCNLLKAKLILRKVYKLKSNYEVKKIIKRIDLIIDLEKNLSSYCDSEKDLEYTTQVYYRLGNGYCFLGLFKKGIQCYLNMLGCCQKLTGVFREFDNEHHDFWNCYKSLRRAFVKDKQYDKALFYYHQEVEALQKVAPKKLCLSYYKMAKLHAVSGSDFEEIYFAFIKAKTKASEFKNYKCQLMCCKQIIKLATKYNRSDLVQMYENELADLQKRKIKYDSDSDFESSNSDTDDCVELSDSSGFREFLAESEVENEEFDRPKERCKRTKFSIKRNEKGETDLHVAAIKGNVKRVKALIEQGHPVNIRDTAGWTPLHEACNHGYVDIVNILLDKGAEINDKGGPSCDGITPLHDAAINGQLQVLDILINRGASSMVLNNAGETPLECLLAWKRNSALDEEEEAMFRKIVKALKSPLDSSSIVKGKATFSKRIDPVLGKPENVSKFENLKCSKAEQNRKENFIFSRRKRVNGGKNKTSSDSDSSSSSRNESACEMYKNAMKGLRRKKKKFKLANYSKHSSKSALIDSKKYVENCIVDDDEIEEDSCSDKESCIEKDINIRTCERKDNENRDSDCEKTNTVIDMLSKDIEENDKIDFMELEDADRLERFMKEIEATSTPSSNISQASSKQNISFNWMKSIPSTITKNNFEGESKQNEKSLFPIAESKDSSLSDDIGYISLDIKSGTEKMHENINIFVEVFNKLLEIPISKSKMNTCKVDWLISEVAQQYPVVSNYDYHVAIETKSGASLSLSDPLTKVENETLNITVTKWKALPLSDRYEKVCEVKQHPDMSSDVRPFPIKQTVQTQIAEILKSSPATRSFTLSHLKLSSLSLIPICKALKYESFIQLLNLSNNCIGDKGIELIVKVLEKCIVEELDISGCNITTSGIYHLSESLNTINELGRNGLQKLNLSNNPITEDAIEGIYTIIEKLPNLSVLNLDKCELETVIKPQVCSTLEIIQSKKG